MEELLKIIYYDYYNINYYLNMRTDKEIMNFVYDLRFKTDTSFDAMEHIKEYKKKNKKKINNNLLSIKKDKFFAEKDCLHITYPFEQTLERINVIYLTIGDEDWNKILGFNFSFFSEFIIFIIRRILLFNDYVLEKDKQRKREYEEAFPMAKNFYFTKEEFYSFFPNNRKDVDNILNIISIEFNSVSDFKDIFCLLNFNEKYILYFIWDFLYNLHDLIEKEIIIYYQNNNLLNNYHHKKGIEFENICYEKIKENFKKEKIFKNLNYNFKNGNHEIDILMEKENLFIIFECKTSKFDIHQTIDDNDLKNNFLTAFGRGFKTLNDFNDFVASGGYTMYSNKGSKIYNFDFNSKKILYVNISLYNIEYLQTNIQKIDKNLISPVNVYPIVWNFIDFLTFINLAHCNYKLFFEYMEKRFDCINKFKSLTLDFDEIDAFGFLTDKQNEKIYNMIMNESNNIDMRFMINNSLYRNEINKHFNDMFFNKIFNIK